MHVFPTKPFILPGFCLRGSWMDRWILAIYWSLAHLQDGLLESASIYAPIDPSKFVVTNMCRILLQTLVTCFPNFWEEFEAFHVWNCYRICFSPAEWPKCTWAAPEKGLFKLFAFIHLFYSLPPTLFFAHVERKDQQSECAPPMFQLFYHPRSASAREGSVVYSSASSPQRHLVGRRGHPFFDPKNGEFKVNMV